MIFAVTTQAREGIETHKGNMGSVRSLPVTTQAREGIETFSNWGCLRFKDVTTQAREGIETYRYVFVRTMV